MKFVISQHLFNNFIFNYINNRIHSNCLVNSNIWYSEIILHGTIFINAMNAVKEKAKKDFQDDYMTQNYVADEPSKVFDYINGIELKSQEELNVMKKVINDFPNDFMTTEYVYNR